MSYGGVTMSRGTNQKFKFTYLMQIMLAKTDDEHSLTLSQIMDELEKYGVTAERKSLYNDFADMDKFGIEVIKEQIGRETFYHVGSREFELAEVKLLIDAIQSSKFITRTKSRELINKIKSNVSEYQASQLQRQVYINDRVKTMNESVYYNVDDIHTAINENKKIRFKYYKWDVNMKLVPRHNGDWFVVSPWALTWNDENYYLVAYDDIDKKIKHYRVDKMMQISVEDNRRAGKEEFKNFDMAAYSKATFGMYQGTKKVVKIEFSNYMCGVFIDRFGKDIIIMKVDDDHSVINVNVNVSPQFFGWIFSLGKDVKVVGPEDVVEEMKKQAEEFLENLK
ncbi:MAG: WYL domain-containing protein [Paludibacteraceae bacterium]|nr:WYL domain-containing protein [Paludibacteraceae bacterium]